MVPDSLFDDDDSILPRDVIIKRFQQWWTAEQIEEILKDHLISSSAFLENIKHQQSEKFRLDHLQYATILYEQVGEKFLLEEKTKRYRFLPKVLKAVETEQPSNEQEINRMFKKYWPWVSAIPSYSDEVRLEEFLHTLRNMTSKKTFLKELVEIINLPTVCAQRGEKGIDRKTETIDPIGALNPLYDFQNDVSYKIKDMLTNYDDNTSRGIVALPTGCGKTRLVVESVLDWINNGKPGQKKKKFILWIVDRKELCDQAYDAFKAVFTAKGKQDTSLKLHVFYGSKTKNLTDTLEESLSESQSYTTSVIVASIGSLQSICRSQRNLSEEYSSLRDLGKHTALVVIDEAHHAIAESYSHVLTGILDKEIGVKHNTGLGFNFMKNETHPDHARLLGLTATPFRRESDDSLNKESERLRGRFHHNFFWPSLESSSLADEDNHPHAVMELQQSATVDMPVKITAERSFDQDGQIREFYWQIFETDPSETHHRLFNDNPDYHHNQEENREDVCDSCGNKLRKNKTGICKYDTGKKYGQDGISYQTNIENWKKNDYSSDENEKVLHVKDDVFDKPGLYEVFLWVKDDDRLVCIEPDYRVIRINEKIKSSSVKNQSTLKLIYEKLMDAKVLAKPIRWIFEHNSQKYLDSKGITVTYKKQFGKDSDDYSQETLEAIAEEARLNDKILEVIKKLVKEKNKKSILLFANTVAHARLLSTLIRAVLHYNSEYIFAGTHIDERCKFIREFREKKITVLCNYDILTTGFDAPQVDAIINTRLTKSYVLYTQMIGRGLRGPKNGGTDECIVVDFNPKLRKRIASKSEQQRLEAWQFHNDLYVESKTLTNEDLGLEPDEEEAEIKKAKKTWESDTERFDESLSNISKLYKIFKENPELAEKLEYSKFYKYIQKKNVELSVNALESDPNFRFDTTDSSYDDLTKSYRPTVPDEQSESLMSEQEPEIFEKKLSFDDLMHFINHTMRMKSNYQPTIILFLLTRPDKSATRRTIAERLDVNDSGFDYQKVPVYGVLEGHNVVIREEGRSLSDDLFTLNVEDLDEEQTKIVIEALKKKITPKEDKSEPSQNAAEIFEHVCPKCNKVSVKYHKPPTQEENELVEKSFGWRGDRIQSYCIQCRSIKTENKKPGFFSRFQKKRVEKN